MSFETAQDAYFNKNKCWDPSDYHAPRADAFISGWMACREEYEDKIAALQLERDALREALKGAIECGRFDARVDPWIDRWYKLLSTPASGEPARKLCPDCKHSLEDNNHGFDQNDGFLDEHGELVHRGHCTYCRICNPHIFETVRKP